MVELYYLSLDDDGFDHDMDVALDWLDDQERARHQRFKHKPSQQCYLQARRMAKQVLAEKLDCAPADIRFSYNETEKPFLSNSNQWHFNISHCHTAVVVAVAPYEVGVDVENISRCQQVISHAEDFLNPHSAADVKNAKTEEASAKAFATHWCCTEAYVKWLGSAIYREKDRVCARFVSSFPEGKFYEFDACAFTVFEHLNDVRLAIATDKPHREITFIDWRTRALQRFSGFRTD